MADQTSPQATEVQPTQGQGQPTAVPSAVQPKGQGQQGVSDLYAEVLATIPEDQRPLVEPHFKEWDKGVQSKFSEHADYRKRWESFENVEGLEDAGPEGVTALLQFAQALMDPDGARQAILDLAENVGVDLGVAPAQQIDDDPVAALRRELDEIKQAQAAKDEEAQLEALRAEESARLGTEWDSVLEEHKQATGRDLSDEEQARLKELAKRFLGEDEPIKAAYSFIRQVSGAAQTDLVTQAPTPPAPAEPAGRASTTVQPIATFDDVEAVLRQRMKQAATA